jgi:hypothetical protein
MLRTAARWCCCASLLALAGAAEPVPQTSPKNTSAFSYLPFVSGEVLHANTVEYWMLTFRDVVTRPELKGRQLTFDRCQGKAYGGMIYGSLTVDLPMPDAGKDAPVNYRGRFEVAKVDLATLLRELGGNAEGLGGEVAGWVEFSLSSDHPEGMTGQGEFTIRNGSLVQLPVLANLLVGDPGAAKGQDRLDARFDMNEGRVNLVFCRLDSPAAKIAIAGNISYDGDLRLNLEPTFANKLTDTITGGIATVLLNPLTRRAGRFIVRGQITSPVLAADPFGSKTD